MEFLNPAFLFGLAAASIPVIIHLLNLKKLQKIEFSTLAFLKELQKSKLRRIKIKQWLLLALRVLIILLLVMAFSRPTLKGVAIGGTTSAAKTSVVFIIDNTISMSAVDEKGSLLNQVKTAALKLANLLQQGDDASIIFVSDDNPGNIFNTSNVEELKKKIEQTKSSDKRGNFQKAILNAGDILKQSNNFNKEIYILSDFQSNMIADATSMGDLKNLFDEKIRIYTINYSGKNFSNISVDKIESKSQIFEKDKFVNFSVQLTNHSNTNAENNVVSLFINGERNAQKSFSVESGKSLEINIESAIKNTGFVEVQARLEDDDINGDNNRYLNIYVPDKIPVIIFSEEKSDAKFINLALNASNGGNLQVDEVSLNQIQSYDLKKYSSVILIGTPVESSLQKLKQYVENGGGLLIFPSSKEDLNSFKNICSYFNLAKQVSVSGKINSDNKFFVFDKIELQHPLLQNIFEDESKKQFESPEIYLHYKLLADERAKKIIRLNDGSDFLSEYKAGRGKIILCNTSPVLSWSSFPLKSIFVPLMNKSVFYLSSKDREINNYLAGDELLISNNILLSPNIKIVRPDSQEEFIKTNSQNQNGVFNYSKTETAGNYKIYSGEKLVEEFSVNVNPLESETRYENDSEIQEYFEKINFKGTFKNIPKDKNPISLVLQSRYGSELWKFFLIAALLIALVEMFVARNTKKDIAEN
ncbi:MAG: BatA and WFA domain-containing protein [Ignavibacteriales bacterium]|nr:BatA and WFA domain-containing protein [Ignavibacteriales bacterium]